MAIIGLVFLSLFAQSKTTSTPIETQVKDEAKDQNTTKNADRLRETIEASPKLQLKQTELAIKLPDGQELGMVSWIARDSKTGVTWLIQRGEKADPVIAVDKDGRVVHSFGKGLYKIPHAIRLDGDGNV